MRTYLSDERNRLDLAGLRLVQRGAVVCVDIRCRTLCEPHDPQLFDGHLVQPLLHRENEWMLFCLSPESCDDEEALSVARVETVQHQDGIRVSVQLAKAVPVHAVKRPADSYGKEGQQYDGCADDSTGV